MYRTQREFFQKALTAPDQLRQRVVFALDQMWVISALLQGNFQASWMNYYLRTLERNAFGNWRQLMEDVTLSVGMGKYLDMSGNFYVSTRAANENYAREILQLFNVGVDDLNDDGTPILDSQGNRIPTYDQDVVVGFSKAFTGWRLQPDVTDGDNCLPDPPNRRCPNWRDPMGVFGAHDPTPKQLLPIGSDPLPGGGTPQADLAAALDNIFNYHTVPPYVCTNFIQYLVTSNPSPQQVLNCVAAFKGDPPYGRGVRGDMTAMLSAILLDPEARTAPDPALNPNYGKLREPVLAITNLLRNFEVDGSTCSTTGNPCTDFVLGEQFLPSTSPTGGSLRMDEDVFRSPTVFNFFPPNFIVGVGGTTVLGPEFAILSTSTEFARINMMNALIYGGIGQSGDRPWGTRIDPEKMAQYYTGDDGGLVDSLNTLMMHGTMSQQMRDLLVSEVSVEAGAIAKAQKAVYLIADSPSYNVQR
jgi:uncharacterized protein (DUF1800 family)